MINTIVVGYDGAPPARRALEWAGGLARAFGATVIVAVVEKQPLPPEELIAAGGLIGQDEQARNLMTEAADYLQREGLRCETAAALGMPVTELVTVAEERDADLIVVGTHEPGLFERLDRGSVSEGVARKARCDVLIVRTKDDE